LDVGVDSVVVVSIELLFVTQSSYGEGSAWFKWCEIGSLLTLERLFVLFYQGCTWWCPLL